ncbi:hypothetical protein KY348_00285 [Candidatus Woesearchaeota archaeon]|nr:hypothetical protein [Candidatus Woesearchaeota archaeon]
MKRRDFIKTTGLGLAGLTLSLNEVNCFSPKEQEFSVRFGTNIRGYLCIDDFIAEKTGTVKELKDFYKNTFIKYHPIIEVWDKDLDENIIAMLENDKDILPVPYKPRDFHDSDIERLHYKISPVVKKLRYFKRFNIDNITHEFVFEFMFSAGKILGLHGFSIGKEIKEDRGFNAFFFLGYHDKDDFGAGAGTTLSARTFGINYKPIKDLNDNKIFNSLANHVDMSDKRKRLIKALEGQKEVQKYMHG